MKKILISGSVLVSILVGILLALSYFGERLRPVPEAKPEAKNPFPVPAEIEKPVIEELDYGPPAGAQPVPLIPAPVEEPPSQPPKKVTPKKITIPQTEASWQIVYFGPYKDNGANLTILDLFEFSASDVARTRYPIAYFSAHYEKWRPDAKDFGKKLGRLGHWKGESYIDWRDPKNRQVMLKRLDLAVKKGFKGVDIDNVDGPMGKEYFGFLLIEARTRGLTVGLKNFVEVLPVYGEVVDFFVSEATSEKELLCYFPYKQPVVRMGYGRGAKTPPFIFEVRNKRYNNRF